ncbi:indolepyruvate ferredoxin oxidoreductase beta subunit [Caldicoprobacter guelmensis]|uniref:indolepyruvate oxidoreductase subunit beta n=1 Tax=Caldicoprobacter guelmensis TaxID=1170224 RepID=UPI00195E5C86|nr:indolepyruvate oxidoreductase subunit beta [Caldicoprobacter guelmensis]MBM7581571.1 indolepyruvate ferredoxin oxidoreductase beta subunit [Caldicoprobacter guelmensis]
MKYDILIAGVGGQGTVLASRLLAAAAIEAGFFVRTSETIGMAQRGGSVVSHVRIGSEKCSPIIPKGKADLLIGFEPIEAARNLDRLSLNGKCIVNTKVIKPVAALLEDNSYDCERLKDYIKFRVPDCIFVDGYSLAESTGSVKTLNVILIGVACARGLLPFDKKFLENAIKANVPPKYVDLNMKALNIGLRI